MSKVKNGKALPECLNFIKCYIDDNGISPNFDEIREYFGWKSKTNVIRVLDALEERNLIVRIPRKTRSIRLIAPETRTESLWTNYDLDDVVLQFLAVNGIDVADVASSKNPLRSITIDFKAIQPKCKVTFECEGTEK